MRLIHGGGLYSGKYGILRGRKNLVTDCRYIYSIQRRENPLKLHFYAVLHHNSPGIKQLRLDKIVEKGFSTDITSLITIG